MINDRKTLKERCSFKNAFHGKGVDAYSSTEARKKYARSLLRLADKFFWAPIATLLATSFTSRNDIVLVQCILAGMFVISAMYLRHCALVIYDDLPKKRTTPSTSPIAHGVQ